MSTSVEALALELECQPAASRAFIERSDFATSWRGFQREQVVRHLKEIADLVERQEPPEIHLTNELRAMVDSLQQAVASSALEIRSARERASEEARQTLDAAAQEAHRIVHAAEEESTRLRSEAELDAQRIRSSAQRYGELRWRELEEAKERLASTTEHAGWFLDAAGQDFAQIKECLDRTDQGPGSAEELERRAANLLHDLGHHSHPFGDKLRRNGRSEGPAAREPRSRDRG